MLGISNYNYNNKNSFQGLKREKTIQMNNCAQTYNKLQELYKKTERVVPNYGNFKELSTKYSNNVKNLNVNDITLVVKPSILLDERPDERELEIRVMSKDNQSKYSQVLVRGDKRELLEYMRKENLPYEVEQVLQNASDKFEEI